MTTNPADPEYADEFVQGYSLAMIWANTRVIREGQEDTNDTEPYAWQDSSPLWALEAFDPESQASIREDCEAFIADNADDLAGIDAEAGQAGHDFALTRNYHGAGFWDRGYGEAGDRLTKASHPYGESSAEYDGAEFDDGRAVVRLI